MSLLNAWRCLASAALLVSFAQAASAAENCGCTGHRRDCQRGEARELICQAERRILDEVGDQQDHCQKEREREAVAKRDIECSTKIQSIAILRVLEPIVRAYFTPPIRRVTGFEMSRRTMPKATPVAPA